MIARTLSVFALVFSLILPVQAGLARVYTEVFIPNAGQEAVYVAFELVSPGSKAAPQAKKAMRDLRTQVLKSHHLQGPGDRGDTYAKCEVAVRQVDRKDISSYRLACWSIVPGRNDGAHEKYHEAATTAEVLAVGRAFAQEHFRRLQEPAPAPTREKPQDRRTIIRTT